MEEERLVANLRAGGEEAFESLVRKHLGRMLAVAKRILRHEEDARDATQDAFIQAFKNIDRFKGDAKLGTWLHRIVVNTALMRRRSAKSRPAISIEDLLPKYLDDGHRMIPEDPWSDAAVLAVETNETRAIVRGSIERLPDDYRDVVLLRDVEQLDTAETARALGISVALVKTRLHRARQALRGMLEQHVRKGTIG